MRAHEVVAGVVLADGASVTATTVTERNEWLTVHLTLESGETRRYGYYDPVQVADPFHSRRAAGTCPRCREDDNLRWVSHTDEDDDAHLYCANCDYGLCENC